MKNIRKVLFVAIVCAVLLIIRLVVTSEYSSRISETIGPEKFERFQYESRTDISQGNIESHYTYFSNFEKIEIDSFVNGFAMEQFVVGPKRSFDPEYTVLYYIDHSITITGDVLEIYKTSEFRGAPRKYIHNEFFHINIETGEIYTLSDLIRSDELREEFLLKYKTFKRLSIIQSYLS